METLINGYSVIWIFREGFNLFNFQSEDEIIYSVDQSHEEKPCQPGNRLQNWWNMSVCVTWAVMHLVITYPLLLPPQPPFEHPTQTGHHSSSSHHHQHCPISSHETLVPGDALQVRLPGNTVSPARVNNIVPFPPLPAPWLYYAVMWRELFIIIWSVILRLFPPGNWDGHRIVIRCNREEYLRFFNLGEAPR